MPVNVIRKQPEEDIEISLDNPLGVTEGHSSVTLFKKAKVSKAETVLLKSSAGDIDDEFEEHYFDQTVHSDKLVVMRPPYPLKRLSQLVEQNNSLGQLVAAMEVNIDGTGYDIDIKGEETATKEEEKDIAVNKEFFDEIFPGESFTTVRRKIRRDQEIVGNAYLEVIRALDGELVFVRHVQSDTIRLVKLDDPVDVMITVPRMGEDREVIMSKRERRFVQKIGQRLVYFKEYGTSRDLNKETGKWAVQGEVLDLDLRATELLHFFPFRDNRTPYGLPRWVAQTPSILGSRKAEEFNIDFFNSGGVPPVLIFVQGGSLTDEVRKQVQAYLSGRGSNKHRGGVIEVMSSSGDINGAGNVRVTVERFGSERQKDSMFEMYDERCERRVRSSFRLPPIFVGKTEDYSFACYDEKTETLTDRGWIKWDEFKQGMKIACYSSESEELVFAEPIGGVLAYDVKNVEMHRFKGKSLDMMVTPNHKMHWVTPYGKKFLGTIESMLEKCSRPRFVSRVEVYKEGGTIDSFTPSYVPLRGGSNLAYDYAAISIAAADFLSLIGWYLSDGHIDKVGFTSFSICQKESRYWQEIKELFTRLELSGYALQWHKKSLKDICRVGVSNKSLYHWVSKECGRRSHTKKIPEFIKGLNKSQLELFFDSLMKGDGSFDSRFNRSSGYYATVSKQLAEDVQEVAVKLGYRTKMVSAPPGTYGIRPGYRVFLSKGGRAGGDGRLQGVRYKDHYSLEEYTGKVYCFSVPTGIFVTRRNGVVAIQGNTAFASYTVAEAQVFGPERQEFDEIMNNTLMREMPGNLRYKSLPLSVNDVMHQLKGLEMVRSQLTKGELVESVNQIVNLDVKVSEGTEDEPVVSNDLIKVGQGSTSESQPGEPAVPGGSAPTPAGKSDDSVQKMDSMELVDLSRWWGDRLLGRIEPPVEEVESKVGRIKTLKGSEKILFESYVTLNLLTPGDDGLNDPKGTTDLCCAAAGMLMDEETG